MFFNYILDYVYPKVCGICGKRIKSMSYTCTNCLSILKCYKERIIHGDNKYYDYMLNLYEYRGIIKKQICKFKFNNEKYIGKTFAELLTMKIQELNIFFDVIIPVPISQSRYFERGYNQCKEISKYIGRMMNKKVDSDLLLKIKNNKRQSELGINERKNNVIGAYKINFIERVKNKRVLLIDDIYTTGATINECAKMLKEAGAKKVIVITIAYV